MYNFFKELRFIRKILQVCFFFKQIVITFRSKKTIVFGEFEQLIISGVND